MTQKGATPDSATVESTPSGLLRSERTDRAVVGHAREQNIELVGPGGLLNGLSKTVLETALGAEMTEYLGYVHPDPDYVPGLTRVQIESLCNEPRDWIDYIFVNGLEVVAADYLGGDADDSDAPMIRVA